MNITFRELRHIKHLLPTGSINKIAEELQIEPQTVRNYFGASKYQNGGLTGKHVQPGPEGGIVSLKDTTILDMARRMIEDSKITSSANA